MFTEISRAAIYHQTHEQHHAKYIQQIEKPIAKPKRNTDEHERLIIKLASVTTCFAAIVLGFLYVF